MRLVQATSTPQVLVYVFKHLHPPGDPTLSWCFNNALCHVRLAVIHRFTNPDPPPAMVHPGRGIHPLQPQPLLAHPVM